MQALSTSTGLPSAAAVKDVRVPLSSLSSARPVSSLFLRRSPLSKSSCSAESVSSKPVVTAAIGKGAQSASQSGEGAWEEQERGGAGYSMHGSQQEKWQQMQQCLMLGQVVPDMEFDSTAGRMSMHQFIGSSWAVLFSHSGDFTPVCTTELGKIAKRCGEFEKRGVKLIGLSCDSVEDHETWIKDIEAYMPDVKVTYPLIADPTRELSARFNMLDPDMKDADGRPRTSRALHIIGPDKKLKLSFLYPGSTGRNFDEVLRAIDALQLAVAKQVATPSDWQPGGKVVVPPSLSEEEANNKFPGHETVDLPSGKKYLRFAKA